MIAIKKRGLSRKMIAAAVSLVLIAGAVVAVVIYYQHRNQSGSNAVPTPTATASPRPVNSVDYSTPSAEEQRQNVEQKQQALDYSAQSQASPTPGSSSSNISVSIARANQTAAGQPLNVRAVIYGTSSGNCLITLTKSGQPTVNKSFAVTTDATYASCGQADIPMSALSTGGQWNLSLTVQSDSAKSQPTTTAVTITK